MNKELLESQWTQIRDFLKEKFSYLTDEDIRQINGRYDQLVSKLQQKYGYSREEAEERIKAWNFDRFATAPRTAGVREDRIYREEKKADNSFLKWALAIGIPLLLLAAYFSATRVPEVTQPPAPTVTQERTIVQTPEDQFISNSIRNSLMTQQNIAFDMQNVNISTHNGVVTLSGTVPNRAVHDSIVNTAQNFSGVQQVVDNLIIR